MLTRPDAGEHAEYYGTYVRLVPDGDFATVMAAGHAALSTRLRAAASKAHFRYAPGKWSLAESVQHLVDAERVFTYRMVSILRGDVQALPSFDENTWAPNSHADARDFVGLVDEFDALRAATIALVSTAPASTWANIGTMSGTPASARALAYIIAGHERHHDALYRDKYGV